MLCVGMISRVCMIWSKLEMRRWPSRRWIQVTIWNNWRRPLVSEDSICTDLQCDLSAFANTYSYEHMSLFNCCHVSFCSLGNAPPSMEGGDVLNATLGETVVFNFTVTDNDTFEVTLDGIPPPAADYSLSQNGNVFVFSWTPSSPSEVSLIFIANDTTGLSSELHPLVRLCACALTLGATCVESNVDGGENQFILEACECGAGIRVLISALMMVMTGDVV